MIHRNVISSLRTQCESLRLSRDDTFDMLHGHNHVEASIVGVNLIVHVYCVHDKALHWSISQMANEMIHAHACNKDHIWVNSSIMCACKRPPLG